MRIIHNTWAHVHSDPTFGNELASGLGAHDTCRCNAWTTWAQGSVGTELVRFALSAGYDVWGYSPPSPGLRTRIPDTLCLMCQWV